jgi:bifunctional enzyme CysN/CysC
MHSPALKIVPQEDPVIVPAEQRALLRFITCGSVDDGKSTLIGRLLYDSAQVFDDQLGALEKDSRKFGTQGEALDLALLVDGLAAEREQGITIDVAYRYFATPRRAFIVADTPGHEQYTRNMATGASSADLAIILIDARKGVLPQTRRHSAIVSMVGVRHVIIAINKMDLVDFSEEVFRTIEQDYRVMAAGLGFAEMTFIPLSAKNGDNVTTPSPLLKWYQGPCLIAALEEAQIEARLSESFRFPVQWVNRPDADFRGFSGTIVSGAVKQGDAIMALPSGKCSTIARIVTADKDLPQAFAGQAPTLTLSDEIDISRGDVLVLPADRLRARKKLVAQVLWMVEAALEPGRDYIIKLATSTANATIAKLHHALDIESFTQKPASTLPMNGIGLVDITLDKPLVAANYKECRELGAFILIDRLTNETVALGLVDDKAAQELARVKTSSAAHPSHTIRQTFANSLNSLLGNKDEPLARALAKALSWRLLCAVLLGLGIYLLTYNAAIAGLVAGLDALLRPFLRHAHRFVWQNVAKWALRSPPRDLDADGSGI